MNIKNIGTSLIGIGLVAYLGFCGSGCSRIEEWAEKQQKHLDNQTYNALIPYTNGTKTDLVDECELPWTYASRDIKANPQLNKLMKETGIDMVGLTNFYKSLNKDKSTQSGKDYNIPNWNFN